MTGMCTMISRLGCCNTRHRPGSSFSFSAATLKRAACASQGFFSCSSVSAVSIKILRRLRQMSSARRTFSLSGGQTLRVYAGCGMRARQTRQLRLRVWRNFKRSRRFALFCQLHPEFAALVRFAVERLRDGRWTAHFAEQQDFQLEFAGVAAHLQHVPNFHLARRLCRLSVRKNASELTSSRSQRARLEKSGSPEPLVHPHLVLVAHREDQTTPTRWFIAAKVFT